MVHGFSSPQDTVTWTVIAPKEDDYVVSVLFSKREQVNLESELGSTRFSHCPVHGQDLGVSSLPSGARSYPAHCV